MAVKRWKQKLGHVKGKLVLSVAGLLLTAGLSMTADAAGNEFKNENNSGMRNSNTQVFVGVSKEVPKDVSFEVPLFYTMVIASEDPAKNAEGRHNRVLKPANYQIENLTYKVVDGEKTPYLSELAVVDMRVQGMKGSGWSLVEQIPDTAGENDKLMKVSIGGVTLPAITAGDDRTIRDAVLKQEGSVFCNKRADGSFAYQLIGNTNGLDRVLKLDVQVDISPKYRPKEIIEAPDKTDPNTSGRAFTQAQFKVMYTLAPLDINGEKLSAYDQIWVDQHYKGPFPEHSTTGNP